MRNSTRTLLAMVALVLAVATGCSSGDDGSDRGGSGGGSTTTTGDGDSTDEPAQEADDPVVDEIGWDRTADDYRDVDGDGDGGGTVSVTCAAGGTPAPVWGTGPFTAESSICTAAVFAGRITAHYGGEATFELSEGRDSYEGGESNGVSAQAHGPSEQSFEFVG